MATNVYDQGCRKLLRLFAVVLLAWLLRLTADKMDFAGWLDTRGLPWPGEPDRTCDTVAYLRDLEQGGLPFAVPVEFCIDPDPLMFGRGLRYLGGLWEECRPDNNPKDRFEVGLLVVNLRGRGDCSRKMALSGTSLLTHLGVVEVNLSQVPAQEAMQRIEAGEWPAPLLAWIPLFQGADDPAIISGWRPLADAQTDPDVRAVLPMVLVFAEAAGLSDAWQPVLEGWNVVESKIMKEWNELFRKEGHKEGLKEGLKEGKASTLLRLLGRSAPVPADLDRAIRAIEDPARLDALVDLYAANPALDDFRRAAGL